MFVKRRLLIGFAVALICVAGGLFLTWRASEEGRYQGKSVKTWTSQLYSTSQQERDAAVAALKTLGSNAVPDLILVLQSKDSFFRAQAWANAPKLPLRLRLLLLR